ncbi:MAG: hypothetical protein H7Y17_15800 [Chlorobia bacterium]|nr:hypothetical protein [Fimbriimonadaceae bacterium]
MSETHDQPSLNLHKYQSVAGLLGIVGVAVMLAGLFSGQQQAWQAYLFGWVVWVSLSVGCLGLILLKHCVNGRWGLPVLRLLEAGASFTNFLILLILFLPILYTVFEGKGVLYPWANPEKIASDHVLHAKAWWLNQIGFGIRTIIYFVIFMGMAAWLRASTLRQDQNKDDKERAFRTNLASPGLLVFMLVVTAAFTDWVMSLEPYWSSTIYGAWWAVGMTLMAFAFVTAIAALNKNQEPYKGIVTPSWTRDMGNLMLAFTMLWGYTSLSQYLIIWSGNLPEFITYFVNRSKGGWNAIGMATMLGQFFIPFFALLSPRVKAQAPLIAKLCGWILVIRLVDMYYVIMPAMRGTPMPSFWDFVAVVGVGGAWVYGFTKAVSRAPLMPSYDPRLTEAVHAH